MYVRNNFNLCISPQRHLPVLPSSLCLGNMKDHQSPFWSWQFHLVKLHHKLGPSHRIWFLLSAYPACKCHHISHLTWQSPEEVLPDRIMDIGMVTCHIWLRIRYKFEWSEIGWGSCVTMNTMFMVMIKHEWQCFIEIPNTKKRVESMTCCRVFLTNFRCLDGWWNTVLSKCLINLLNQTKN